MNLRIIFGFLLLTATFSSIAQETPESWPSPVKDSLNGIVLFDRLEVSRNNRDENIAVWDMIAWYGGDTYRLYFKSEGENQQNDGEPTDIERAELLASRLIAPFWEFQVGIGTRGELTSESNMENYAVLSLYGMAPYQFEVDSSLIINEDGDISISMEAEYDYRISQTSYIQPRISVSASLSESERFDRPTGFNAIRVGLRYRMEVSREFAPYVGAYWSRALGNSADKLRSTGDPVHETGIVLGARVWF
ncbi:copper resistance protein B [Alteromonas oceanisediminis]|uniref:copper resistance protein B n=1 Tax=Alteromonas oceanisediminis TaxID=2836180 RepID=UPI001BD9927B|nr:copper resistance protein B [Alteromonas oceanisediminis]MBT0587992.1 copper resistance protein B [Alteromonas oceanisediminis]